MLVRGYAVHNQKEKLAPIEFNRRELKPNDICLKITYAGICHSDIHTAREEWGGVHYPLVPGHEIVGEVLSVGASVTKFKVGEIVGVGVYIDSCRSCAACNQGLENYCENGMTLTYNQLERDGESWAMGGYSNGFVVDERYAVSIPENLPISAVAPLLCAGITLYSPLRHWQAGPGKSVAIMGLGGLGHMGVKFAAAMGAQVTVLSHSESKRADAIKLGAHHFHVLKEPADFAALKSQFDLILNTVSASLDLNAYTSLLKLDGTLVLIGIPTEPYSLRAGSLLSGRKGIAGSTVGGMKELAEMMQFCGEHNIVSEVEVISADYINTAYDRTVASDVRYRFVIDAQTF